MVVAVEDSSVLESIGACMQAGLHTIALPAGTMAENAAVDGKVSVCARGGSKHTRKRREASATIGMSIGMSLQNLVILLVLSLCDNPSLLAPSKRADVLKLFAPDAVDRAIGSVVYNMQYAHVNSCVCVCVCVRAQRWRTT